MFGGASGETARSCMVPIPLFASAYYSRGGYQHPHGIWPGQSYMRIQMDSATVLEYEDSDIIRMLHYQAGYEGTEAEVPARFIFGAHTGRYQGFYTGGINFDNCTNVLVSMRFHTSATLNYEIIGIRYCKFIVNSSGFSGNLMSKLKRK